MSAYKPKAFGIGKFLAEARRLVIPDYYTSLDDCCGPAAVDALVGFAICAKQSGAPSTFRDVAAGLIACLAKAKLGTVCEPVHAAQYAERLDRLVDCLWHTEKIRAIERVVRLLEKAEKT